MCPDEDSLCGIRTIQRFSETLIQPYVCTYVRTGNGLFLKTAAHDSRILNSDPDKEIEYDIFFVLLDNTGKIVLLVNY